MEIYPVVVIILRFEEYFEVTIDFNGKMDVLVTILIEASYLDRTLKFFLGVNLKMAMAI